MGLFMIIQVLFILRREKGREREQIIHYFILSHQIKNKQIPDLEQQTDLVNLVIFLFLFLSLFRFFFFFFFLFFFYFIISFLEQ